jgi:flagellar M-ring protein FliF
VASPPAVTPVQAVGSSTGQQRTQERRNFEVDRTTTRTVRPRGGIARLSVAVLVDNAVEFGTAADGSVTRTSKPRDPAFLQQVNELVSRAAGLDTARGDVLTVQNIGFEPAPDEVPVAAPAGLLQRVSPLWIGVAAAAVLSLLGGLVLVMRRGGPARKPGPSPTVATEVLPQQQLPRTIQEIEGEIEAQLDAEAAAKAVDRKMPVLTKRVSGLVQSEPEAAARLVRSWLLEEKKA